MYFLVVQNLGLERCIHRGEEDIYNDGMTFSCIPDLAFPGGDVVREVSILCSEVPDPALVAKVYRD